MSNLNYGFSKNQRIALTRIENFYKSSFPESLEYTYHGLERLEFNLEERELQNFDFMCEDFSAEDFYTDC